MTISLRRRTLLHGVSYCFYGEWCREKQYSNMDSGRQSECFLLHVVSKGMPGITAFSSIKKLARTIQNKWNSRQRECQVAVDWTSRPTYDWICPWTESDHGEHVHSLTDTKVTHLSKEALLHEVLNTDEETTFLKFKTGHIFQCFFFLPSNGYRPKLNSPHNF
jgi:hypothetical protein